jgi:hypothetical protein
MLGQHVHLTDCWRLGAFRFYVEVALLEEAEQLVSARCRLKGTGYTLFDALSLDEAHDHKLLWPQFIVAQQQGKRAQFKRAALFVDGVRVHL